LEDYLLNLYDNLITRQKQDGYDVRQGPDSRAE
jgi:hypothetical protein